MMINKRLIALLGSVKRYIAGIVIFQWIALLANIAMVLALASLLQNLFAPDPSQQVFLIALLAFAGCALIRAICAIYGSKMSFLTSVEVKATLRAKVYRKVLALGAGYTQDVRTAEVVQIAGEGVEQLELYFGRYLPQLFYGALAPITLFCALAFVNVPAAAVLLVATPLILVAIMTVSKMAKRIFARYWGIYTDLGANFLENLQGLTTLKIYQADTRKLEEMADDAESFRKVTMKVLTGQLGSIASMDFVAFGGAAVGIIVALFQLQAGAVGIAGCLAIILLSAEFFIPMRQLGSYFHIAMNGVAASDKIFALLDRPQNKTGQANFGQRPARLSATLQHVGFAYDDKPVLQDVSLEVSQVGLTSIVGKSGSGKSTLAQAIMGGLHGYSGHIGIRGYGRETDGACRGDAASDSFEVRDLSERAIMQNITLVTAHSHVFKGSVRENLLIAAPAAGDEELWAALAKVRLDEFLRSEAGLDTPLAETASNLSGGQRQRLALARALLHDTPFYIFDEATSNVDAESESFIMEVIHDLARTKAVLLISHRLANVVGSQNIFVLQDSLLVEQGEHGELMDKDGYYANLFNAQNELESFNPSGQDPCQSRSTGQAEHKGRPLGRIEHRSRTAANLVNAQRKEGDRA